jgi:2-(1,2-epoxy-1,2-dihydrophenyl)acetyl-CoA isomerase
MPETDLLLSEFQQGVLTIILNRPKVNALNLELISALQTALRQVERDPQVRCVLLTGSGSVFSAGQDVSEFAKGPVSIRYHLLRTYNPLVVQICKLEKPVLAAINGVVSGATLGLALACDLRIASDQARFVVGFSGIRLAPDSAVSLLLPALIGLGRASEYTFANAPITAEQALAWGLVNRLAPADRLNQEAGAWAQQLARGPVGAMALAKRDFNKATLGNLEKALDYEAYIQDIAGKGSEHAEGMAAFLEKRPAKYI